MDIATITGIAAGFGLIVITILLGGVQGAGGFLDIPSLMVVVGGSTAATLVNYPLRQMMGVIKVAARAFRHQETDERAVVDMFVKYSRLTRRDGILALDRRLNELEIPFMKAGLEMAVDGTEPDTIREIMQSDLRNLSRRHQVGRGIFISLGTYAPAFGMIGTLIGLVQMLGDLEDPDSIGPSMAVALITTLYGAVLGNLVYLPLAGKLKNKSDEEVRFKRMIIEGVLSIQQGVHPRHIERQLLNYIPPDAREPDEEPQKAAEGELDHA